MYQVHQRPESYSTSLHAAAAPLAVNFHREPRHAVQPSTPVRTPNHASSHPRWPLVTAKRTLRAETAAR